MSTSCPPPSRRTALLVEDEPAWLELLANALTAAGWRVLTAGTLRLAKKAVEASLPDLVIAEMVLPDGSVLDWCRALSRQGVALPVPMVITSPLLDRDWVRRAALEAGAAGLLRQPLEPDDVVSQAELLHRVFSVARTGPLRQAIVAHDLRVPLDAIAAATSVLEAAPLDERAAKAAAVIKHSAARMSELLFALLDYSALVLGGGASVRTAPVDLTRLCSDLVEEVGAATARPITLTAPKKCLVRCDRGRLGQVVANLLTNALQHGDAASPVDVRLDCKREQAVIVVQNRGAPIPADRLPHLYDAFLSRDPSGPGLGLGLFIARELTEAHGGTIDAECTPDGVTRFTVSIPGAAPAEEQPAANVA